MSANQDDRGRFGALTRRRFVQGLALASYGVEALWRGAVEAQTASTAQPLGLLSGQEIRLVIGPLPVNITGRRRVATAVNGSVPAPILRLRQGDTATIHVTNQLEEVTSVHWHAIRLPADQDGVPGLTFAGIRPGETFTYRFPVVQGGTYWYHSHSGMQEQTGLYGPLVLVPRDPEPYAYDRDYVVMLSDWTDEDPMTVVANLKQQSDYYNYHRRTVGTFLEDAKKKSFKAALSDRLARHVETFGPTSAAPCTNLTRWISLVFIGC